MRKLHVAIPAVFITGAISFFGGCGDTGVAATACGDGNLGTSEVELQVEAVYTASQDVHDAAQEVEDELLAVCTNMADDLMIPAADREPTGTETEMVATCTAVKEKIDAVNAMIPVGAGIIVNVEPARCDVNIDAAASCAGECDVTIEGSAEVECMGTLHGSCSAQCTGSCTIEGNVACTGSCTGTCTGTCSGNCSSTTEGGECAGACDGTCTGMCEGSCTATIDATCEGECSGSCSAEWEAECNGTADLQADADCKAACEAEFVAEASCDDPTVDVAIYGVDPATVEEVARLAETLEENLPRFVALTVRVNEQLFPALDALATSSAALADSVTEVGTKAAACIVVAVDESAQALASINASVSITVEVSASAHVEG